MNETTHIIHEKKKNTLQHDIPHSIELHINNQQQHRPTNTIQINRKQKKQIGGLSKPRPIKSVIGLFRRESTTSGSVAGSDPSLASQLALDMASMPRTPGRSTGDRRSISICAVEPIDESNENGYDPLGALSERGRPADDDDDDDNFLRTAERRRQNHLRRNSLLDLNR